MSFDNNSAIGLDSDPCLALGIHLDLAESGFGPQTLLRWFVVVVGSGGGCEHWDVDVEFQWFFRGVKTYDIPFVATAASHHDILAGIAVDESGFIP